jgi:acyl carrier protein
VRRHSSGEIEFLGRLDHQVKLRGYRIELGEIEAVLSRYPGVKEAIVVVREDIPAEKRLVAYLTSDQQAISVSAIREFLTGKLPNYMHPSAVVRMDALPLTPNGKIDRTPKHLPTPDVSKSAREREFTPPTTNNEKVLASIWAEVLHLDRVGINDNLFELGADSLHIFQIAARAAKAGIAIAPALFLRYRTIASLLAQLETKAAAAANSTAVAIPSIVPVARDKYRVKRPL